MKTAFLFSGQGSQYVGMGKDLYEHQPIVKELFDSIQLDFDLKALCFEGPEETLQDTAYAQACIFVLSTAIAKVLSSHGIQADGCAGLSLGEYSAYAYANAFSIQEGAVLTRERGKLMAHSLPTGTSAMAAIMMLEEQKIVEACKAVEAQGLGVCEIANYNCPGQIVITGHREAVEACMKICQELGARKCIPLQVSGAFHSSLLKAASKQLGNVLDTCKLKEPTLPVYNNITGTQAQGTIKDILMKQICQSVFFEQLLRTMYEDGYRRFIELGPGSTVSGFVKKTLKGMNDISIYHIENQATLESFLTEMEMTA